jgi:predicted amidohydrolase YtcJ
LLIRGTEAGDVRIAGGVIAEIGHDLAAGHERVIDAGGGALIPGLHDHHVHLRAMAAARASVDLTGASGGDLARRLRDAPGQWVRAIGYHESIAGSLDRWRIDALVPDRPVRIQHRTGEQWVLSSAAARAVGLPDDHDGRVWRDDGWLGARVPPVELDLPALGREAAARGVTGFTDTTPDRTAGDAASLAGAGLAQRLHLLVPPDVDVPATPLVSAGPVKVLLDDATLPTVDELAATVSAAHAAGRRIAVHCVTRVQLIVALAAGLRAGDRIEHGAVIPPELLPELARTGVVVITQPNFVAERGAQYRADVDPHDLPSLYRCASLLDAGVAVAAGTDAPFGGADPWAAMRAAVSRELGPEERVAPVRALALFLGAADDPAVPRRIHVGAPADLCLLHVPLADGLRELDDGNVRATFVAGEEAAS